MLMMVLSATNRAFKFYFSPSNKTIIVELMLEFTWSYC